MKYSHPVSLKALSPSIEPANIPGYLESLKKGFQHEITLPDIHGNPMKGIAWLLAHDVIRFKDVNAKQTMNRLHEIHEILWQDDTYNDAQKTKALLDEFKQILKEDIEANDERAHHFIFRFIGDVLADRGANDLLTLYFLDAMKNDWRLTYKLHYGNHDDEFLCWYENRDTYPDNRSGISRPCKTSLQHLKQCLSNGIVSEEEITSLVDDLVTPHWTVFDVNVLSDNQWVMFGHSAPLIPTVFEAAKDLGMELLFDINDCTKAELFQLIHDVNDAFRRSAKEKKTTTANGPASYVKRNEALDHAQFFPDRSLNCMGADYPFAHVAWVRRVMKHDEEAHQACAKRLGLTLHRVCGHLGDEGASVLNSTKTDMYAQGQKDVSSITDTTSSTEEISGLINLDKNNMLGRPVNLADDQSWKASRAGKDIKNMTFEDIHYDEGDLPMYACHHCTNTANLYKKTYINQATIRALEKNEQASKPLWLATFVLGGLSITSAAGGLALTFISSISTTIASMGSMGLGIGAGVLFLAAAALFSAAIITKHKADKRVNDRHQRLMSRLPNPKGRSSKHPSTPESGAHK